MQLCVYISMYICTLFIIMQEMNNDCSTCFFTFEIICDWIWENQTHAYTANYSQVIT